MNRRANLLVVIVLGAILLLSGVVFAAGRVAYSSTPLRECERDAAANAVEFTMFNNWLNTNYESVPADRRQSFKEHLFSVIDSHVKQLHGQSGITYPAESDLILAGCYAWATRMGAFGADQVLGKLDPDTAKLVGRGVAETPDSFKLSMDGDQFVLSSSLGPWRVSFPYYFMVGDLRDIEAKNGLRTQTAIISTGFGRNAGRDDWSQATIMLVFSPVGSPAAFKEFWIKKFGFSADEQPTKSGNGIARYKRFDAKNKLHTELVFPESETGAMAVSYMGLDGTYQWNEEHFENFLEALQTSAEK